MRAWVFLPCLLMGRMQQRAPVKGIAAVSLYSSGSLVSAADGQEVKEKGELPLADLPFGSRALSSDLPQNHGSPAKTFPHHL